MNHKFVQSLLELMWGLAFITFCGNGFYSLSMCFLLLNFKSAVFYLNSWFSHYKKLSMTIASSLSSYALGFTGKLRYREAVCPKSLRKSFLKWRTRHRCAGLPKKSPNRETLLPHTTCRCPHTLSTDTYTSSRMLLIGNMKRAILQFC